jgi:hypothetical protein
VTSGVNDPPVAVNDVTNTVEDVSVTIQALANDSDVDGDTLSLTSVSPTNGTAVISGTNVVFTPATNFFGTATIGYSISDGNGGSASALITVIVTGTQPQFGILAGTNVLNRQTGLFEQRVTVTNIGVSTVAAFQLLVGDIRSPQGVPRTNVFLYNATGTNTDSRPYVQYNAPLNPGQFVQLILEFVVLDRRPFTNSLEAVAVTWVPGGTNAGAGVAIDRSFLDLRIAGEPRYVIEFTSIPGRIYTIIYSDDNMATWKVATPSITAIANRTQWYDDGPPKTDSKPLLNSSRFYGVIPAP